MKQELRKLLRELGKTSSVADATVKGITYDSRRTKPGDLFVCIEGLKHDGHDYITEAVQNGCIGVVVQKDVPVPEDTIKIKVPDTRLALGRLAAAFYGNPSQKLKLIGVTGTNGKTSTTHLIEEILRAAGHRTGLIGTIYNKVGLETLPAERTTPEASDVQKILHQMVTAGVEYCVMEVSSHAISLHRVEACDFDVGVLTNISQDHLDFHHNLDEYRGVKRQFFSLLARPSRKKGTKTAVINLDDPSGQQFASDCRIPVVGYGIKKQANLRAVNINMTSKGTGFNLIFAGETIPIQIPLMGLFNVYNSLASIGVAAALGVANGVIQRALVEVGGIPGRFELIDEGQEFSVIVDYAHTPDGLENAVKAAREFSSGKVILLFGCGGDRDRSKRPLMGRVAAKYADYIIVTSDNPRSEEPKAIVADIEPGLKLSDETPVKYSVVMKREEAIERAIGMAQKGDIVILAGKGHETGQIIGQKVFPFDDRKIAREVLRRIGK